MRRRVGFVVVAGAGTPGEQRIVVDVGALLERAMVRVAVDTVAMVAAAAVHARGRPDGKEP